MDIRGINRTGGAGSALSTGVKRNNGGDERDAQGSYDNQRGQDHLTKEQEEEAIAKLRKLPAFAHAGLTIEVVREAGKALHALVRDANGAILRHVPYEQIVSLYLDRNNQDNQKGRLLRKSA